MPPPPFILPSLPIGEALAPLAAALAGHRRVLLHAPPGAGKSTVVPLALLGSGWLEGRKILMLEPRRIAARAVAHRMAQIVGEPVGKTVGFRTRLETRVSRDTLIEVVTEGILTRMLQSDPELGGIGCVIFDEFHERSLNADLGLALCIESQEALREDLRLMVMSATLDLEPLARLLGDAPVIRAEGRSHEVTTRYVPRRPELTLELQTVQVLHKALADDEGDILCFLPGAAEIGRVQRTLEESALDPSCRVQPLYGDLSGAAQDAALRPAPAGQRKIVLATTIAETSLTIEGIRVVIDSGMRRYSAFDPATGMSRLVTGKVSQAAADQRRGRAGRLSTGVCYRLWSEGAQASLAPHTAPEILNADLAPLALELGCWGAADVGQLRWLDPPPAAPLAQARELLRDLDALDETNRITPHGRALSDMGTHPRLAHMLIRGRDLEAARLASDLAAVLSERDVLRTAPGSRDADLRLRVGALRGEVRSLPSCNSPRALPPPGSASSAVRPPVNRSIRTSGRVSSSRSPTPTASGAHATARGAICWPTAGAPALPSRKRSPNRNSSWRRNSTARIGRRAFSWRLRFCSRIWSTCLPRTSRCAAVSPGTIASRPSMQSASGAWARW